MKIHLSALGLVLISSLAMAKTIPTPEPATIVTEKKSLVKEDIKKPSETTETPVALAIEDAEEPKQADRAKKSASTTFCVEIRPGAAETPVKVCDEHNPPPPPPPPPPPQHHEEPQPPQIHHEVHHHEIHPAPTHPDHEQFFVLPPNPFVVFPNDQQPFVNFPSQNPNGLSQGTLSPQQIIIPSGSLGAFGSSQQFFIPSSIVPGSSQQFIIPSSSVPGSSQPFLIPSSSVPASSQQFLISSSSVSGSPQQILLPSSVPGSSPQIVIPSTSVSGLSQHVINIPSGGSGPCPPCPNSPNGIHPHAFISLYRSGMSPPHETLKSAMMNDPMGMRSNSDDFMRAMHSGMPNGMDPASYQDGPLAFGRMSPFARTHTKKLYTVPITPYSSTGGYQSKSTPYVVQCNPQVLSLGPAGRMRDASDGNTMNMDAPSGNIQSMGERQPNLGTPHGGRHVIHPVVQPIIHTSPGLGYDGYHHHGNPGVYHQSSSIHTYQSDPSYVSPHGGYHVSPVGPFYRGKGAPNMQRMNDHPHQLQFQEKSWNQEAPNMERASSGMNEHQSAAMSPSQMLNQMRGSNSAPGWHERPMMHSFPRDHEDNPCKDEAHQHGVNIHISKPGSPFMIHEELGKREAEKSAVTENDA